VREGDPAHVAGGASGIVTSRNALETASELISSEGRRPSAEAAGSASVKAWWVRSAGCGTLGS